MNGYPYSLRGVTKANRAFQLACHGSLYIMVMERHYLCERFVESVCPRRGLRILFWITISSSFHCSSPTLLSLHKRPPSGLSASVYSLSSSPALIPHQISNMKLLLLLLSALCVFAHAQHVPETLCTAGTGWLDWNALAFFSEVLSVDYHYFWKLLGMETMVATPSTPILPVDTNEDPNNSTECSANALHRAYKCPVPSQKFVPPVQIEDPIVKTEDPPVQAEDPPVRAEDPPVKIEEPPVRAEDPIAIAALPDDPPSILLDPVGLTSANNGADMLSFASRRSDSRENMGTNRCPTTAFCKACKSCCIETVQGRRNYDPVRDARMLTNMKLKTWNCVGEENGVSNCTGNGSGVSSCGTSPALGFRTNPEECFFQKCSRNPDCRRNCRREFFPL